MSAIEASLELLAARVRDHAATLSTEEAVKTSVILPFLQALGYDVFDPAEVTAEFTADVVDKKGEKVDYAVRVGDDIAILIECKSLGTKLEKPHLSQLFRYFSVTNAKFAILTNGQEFNFFSDLEAPNKLDSRPFFQFNLLEISRPKLEELKKFEKSAFDVDSIMATAERLKYVSSVKKFLETQIEMPSDEFVRLIASDVYEGRQSAQVRDMLTNATKSAFREIISDRIRSRLSTALSDTTAVETDDESPDSDIVTTADEIDGFNIIRSIVRQVIDVKRVHMRDSKTYCAVLIDDNNRRPLARLWFNRRKKYIGVFDQGCEDKVAIEELAIFTASRIG